MNMKQNKTAFILSQPFTMTAREVVARAKAKGITISTNLVYVARHAAKNRGFATKPRGFVLASKPAPSPAAAQAPKAEKEHEFRRLVARIGLDRAERELVKVRAIMEEVAAA